MNRYLLITNTTGFAGDYSTLDGAMRAAHAYRDWTVAQIVDLAAGAVTHRAGRDQGRVFWSFVEQLEGVWN